MYNLRDPNKKSGYVLDINDMEKLTDKVIKEIKENGLFNDLVIDLRDIDDKVNRADNMIAENGNPYDLDDTFDRMRVEEQLAYEALQKGDVREKLTSLVSKYYNLFNDMVRDVNPNIP